MVVGLLKFKYDKDHLYSASEQGKSKGAILKTKPITSTDARLQLLHMDLLVYFLRSKDEAPETIKKFITLNQVSLHATVQKLKPKADIGIFIGYSEDSRGFQIYNQRTWKIMETIHVKFDELITMDSKRNMSTNFVAPDTIHNDDTRSSTTIIIAEDEAPHSVSITTD
ncbi:hypothetical protein Tco_1041769 [Tanacetum coccineum]|uniref:Retroviral polymerase SH3-like domain-containing protein n=1 Tax=Tanacetum coccineum TaxID=301880 RepID=A0ABQ5GI91_9ASTR